MQEAAGLPHMVGLDMEPANLDDFSLTPALVVTQVHGLDHADVNKHVDSSPDYLCLTSDNR